jgi:restriction endonuclease Mrr
MGGLREEMRLIQTRREREREAERKAILDSIRELPDDGYQQMVLDIFRRDGYVILKAENNVSDVIDLECQRHGERVFVQYRHRGDLLVAEDAVRQVQAAMVTGGADGGFLFTDGSFTWGADELARQTGIVLVDGNVLVDLMEEMTMADAAQRSGGAKVSSLFKGMFGKSSS